MADHYAKSHPAASMPATLQSATALRYHEREYLNTRRGKYKASRAPSLCKKVGTPPCCACEKYDKNL